MSERIEEIRERLGNATPGPWYQGRNSRRYESSVEVYSHEDMEHRDSHDVAMFATPEDAAFIANAPADVAFLLAEVERLEREKAEAWDEGAESAYFDPETRFQVSYPDNPYRTAQ